MKKIGFYYTYDSNWLGGVYYKKHLLQAIAKEGYQNIIVYTNKESEVRIRELLSDIKIDLKLYDIPIPKYLKRVEDFLRRKFFFSLTAILKGISFKNVLVFDYKPMGILRNVPIKNRIYWIPDLQDRFLPHLFSEDILKRKNEHYTYLSRIANMVVFSSDDSFNAFIRFYPLARRSDLIVNILKFTVLHPKLDFSLLQNIKNKYDIEKYFIVANQFMGHKNHKVVLKAIAYLKSEGLLNSSFKVVMTGKKNDPRDGDVFNNFYKLAVELDVLNNIILTDVIDREDQLLLMHGAISLVQPSYFEGWNSSIEDAKAMNLNIICSSLDVHKEQLKNYYGIFFNPDDYIELAYILLEKFTSEKVLCDNPNYDYSLNQIDFQKELVKVFL